MKQTYAIYLILAVCVFTSCKDKEDKHHPQHDTHDMEYGSISLPEYAKGFHLDHHGGYIKLVIENIQDSVAEASVYYVCDDLKDLEGLENVTSIVRPIQSIACLSTTHLAMIDLLDGWSQLKGLAYADKVIDEGLKAGIDQFEVPNLSSGWNLDREKIMAVSPDVFLTYPYEDEAQTALQDDSFINVGLLEYAEPHPLGRVEWIKVLGCLLDKEDEAEEVFEGIKDRYLAISEKVDSTPHLPITFTGSYFQGQWSVPGGESLAATFIKDAGGTYFFEENKGSANFNIDYETLVSRSRQIKWWGALGFYENTPTKLELAGGDERLLDFMAFRQDRLFYCNTAKVDYFGKGVMEPDAILKDLRALYQPEYRTDHSFKYFFPLEQ